jgi:hypothetical protein
MVGPDATVMTQEFDGDGLDWIWCYAAGVLTGVALAWASVLGAMWVLMFHPEFIQ